MTLLVVQLSHEESLNGVCDIAQAMSYEWERAGMEIPRRNTLSNANTKPDPAMAEDVFWGLFRHLSAIEPDFVSKNYSGYLARIRNHRLGASGAVPRRRGEAHDADTGGREGPPRDRRFRRQVHGGRRMSPARHCPRRG